MSDRQYDAVIVFPFGANAKSATNTGLLRRAISESMEYGVPMIMHEALGETYGKRNLWVTMLKGRTICEYARNAKEDMARETWKNVLVIAATPIIDRCIRDLQKVYPGRAEFHKLEDLGKSTPYVLWFWEKGRRFEKIRATAYSFSERLIRLIPWPIYRWFSLRVW